MTERTPMIDLVAVAYQAPGETARFLQSLENVGVEFTLTVVENNSPDPQVRRVLEQAWDDVLAIPTCVDATLVFNSENVGYARACNAGAVAGSANWLALLNCDIRFDNDQCVPRIIDTFIENPDVAVIGPRTTDSQGRITHGGIIKGPKNDEQREWRKPDRGQVSDTIEVPTVSGATYFMRRSAWLELTACPLYQQVAQARGAFLPTPHYFEETFCSYHAQAHGWRVLYEGRAKMIHEWNKSSKGNSASRFWNESREMYLKACAIHGIENHGA